MDLSLIKNKLAGLQQSSQPREKVDYTKIFWKPKVGTYQVRIVPSKFDKQNPFKEVYFHYGFTKGPILALTNWGEKDPIVEFAKSLRKSSDKEDWQLARKLDAKMRVFEPVIVRGEEDKGVRLWSFGTNIYKALLALAEDEDIGDYTDVLNGYDMVVEQTPGNPYPTTTVRIKPKTSPLSTDNAKVDLWLKEQPNPIEAFTQFDYEYIKKQLQGYLTPGEVEQPAEAAESIAPVAQETDSDKALGSNKTDFTLETATVGKKNTVNKFDDLFNE